MLEPSALTENLTHVSLSAAELGGWGLWAQNPTLTVTVISLEIANVT